MNLSHRLSRLLPLVAGIFALQVSGAPCVSAPGNLAGWWRGDSALSADGLIGGTYRGTAGSGAGYLGQSLVLDGRSDAIQLPPEFKLTSQDFSVEAWVRRASDSLASRDVEAGEFFANGNQGFAFGLTHDGRLYLSHIGVVSFYSTTALRGTNWNHVAVSREGGTLNFYLNGTLANSMACGVNFNLGAPYAVGGLGTPVDGVFYGFWGSIDELAAYNRALSASEIAAIHQAGAAGKCPTGPGNLIVNGSFETPAYSAADGMLPNTAFVRTRNLPGWEVAPGDGAVEIELKNFGGATAVDGGQSLELEGTEGLPAYFIRQDVSTTPGRTYRLKFAYAKNPLQSLSRLRVELAGASVSARDFEHGLANSRAVPVWQQGMVEFVATAATVRVQFTGTSPNLGYGMLLDDVSLQEVRFRSLEVENPGFEQLTGTGASHFTEDGRLADGHYSTFPGFPLDGNGFASANPIPGWTGPAPGGTFNPTLSVLPNGAPEGQNVAWINGAGAIRQRLSETFEAERIYRLSVDVASLAGVPFPGYALALYGNDVAAVQSENPQPVPAGGHVTATVEIKLAKDSPLVGAPIEIRLATLGGNGQGDFDNVRLQVESSTPDAGCANAPTGLVAWYRAEDSTSDHHGQHPTTFAAPRYAAGKVGRAFDFDGSNEVVIPDAADLNFTAFSAEAWVYPTSLDSDVEIIMNKEVNGFDTIAFELGVKGPTSQAANTIPTGNLAVFVGGVSGMPSDYSGWSDAGVAVPLNSWSHVVLTYGDGVANAFVNGVLSRQFTNLTGTLRTTTGPLKIGSRSDSVVANFPSSRFNGRIDEASLYSRALNEGEVGALFNAGSTGKCVGLTCTAPPANLAAWLRGEGDASDWTFAHPGTFAAPKFALGKVGQAFEFDGSNEVVLGDAADFNRDTFTLEAWIYPTSLDGAVDMIANKEAGTDFSQFQFEIGLKGPVNEVTSQIPLGNVAFYLAGVTGLPDEYGGWVDGKGGAPLNQWTHVALAVEPGAVTVFVNGVATRRLTGLGGTLQRTTGPLKLGSRHDNFAVPRPAERFNGRIDEFSFYTRRLADTEISAIHAAGEMGKCYRDAPPGDLELVLEAPAKVALDQDFVLTARLINHGIAPATQVTLTNTVPLGVSVGGVTNSQGSSVNLAGFVISTFGTIGGGQTATVQITCRPLLGGNYTVSGALGRAEIDPVPANDRQELSLEALPLSLALGPDPTSRENDGVVRVQVVLSAAAAGAVEATYRLVDGTAKSGVDFLGTNGVVRFAAGVTESFVEIPLINDRFFEATETFSVELATSAPITLGRTNGVVTIENDDAKPTLSVNDAVILEGNSGGTNAIFTVSLTGASEAVVTVDYTTVSGTASAPTDYLNATGTLTFTAGERTKTVEVRVNGDTAVEANESFQLVLSNVANADLADAKGATVILNDDFVPGQLAGFRWDAIVGSPKVGENIPVRLTAVDGGAAAVSAFNGTVLLQATASGRAPSSVVISEVDATSSSFSRVEFGNVSTNVVDLAGWTVTFYDGTTWPLPTGTVTLNPGNNLPPAGIFQIFETSGAGVFPNLRTEFPLSWAMAPQERRFVAVLLRNASGAIVDFFCAMRALPDQIQVPVSIPPEEWTGLPMVDPSSPSVSYQRAGNADSNSARDWATQSPTPLRFANILTVPFADSRPLAMTPEFAAEFQNGAWTGNVQLQAFAQQVALIADDGNGHRGQSAPFVMGTADDLMVTLTVDPNQTQHPGSLVHYRAEVTQCCETISSNVVVEVRLPAYFGSVRSQVAAVTVSQGTHELGSYFPTGGTQSALLVRASLGQLGLGQSAQLEFDISRQSIVQIQLMPTNITATATVSRTQPEQNLANNSSEAVTEINAGCSTLAEGAVAWWRGETNLNDSLGHGTLELVGTGSESLTYGPGRTVNTSALNLDRSRSFQTAAGFQWNLGANQDFSAELWLRVVSDVLRDRIMLLDKRDPATGVGFALFLDQGRLAAVLTDSTGNTQSHFTRPPSVSAADLRDGRWHHVALSARRDPQVRALLLAVDGGVTTLLSAFEATGDLGNAPLRLGFEPGNGMQTALVGLLDEVTVYSTALNAGQLTTLSRSGGAGKCLADVRLSFAEPKPVAGQFPNPISLGRPLPVILAITNAGPLALPTNWVAVDFSEGGQVRHLTPRFGTNVFSPYTTYYDFGPLAAGAGRLIEVEVTLTNIPTRLRTELAAWQLFVGQNYRFTSDVATLAINPDGDADGAADVWELANGFDPLNAADATADTDGDGFPNVDEFQLGTDPRNATDVLKLELSAADANGVRFRFPGKAGKSYGLFRRALLGDPWSEVSQFTASENAVVELADTTPPADAAFYQVQLLANP